VRRHAEDAEAGRAFAMLNWRRSDGALLGGVTLGHIRRGAAQSAVVGYWIGAAHARRGYTLEAMRLTVAFAFQALGLHRLEASCMPENTASRALLARLGFVEEGLARRSLQIAGAWRDHLSLGLLAEEWPR
jgi:ribosomal-protein-alanine N-acetyltransferase